MLQVARAETFLGADKCPSPSPPPEPVPDCVPAGATYFGPDQCTTCETNFELKNNTSAGPYTLGLISYIYNSTLELTNFTYHVCNAATHDISHTTIEMKGNSCWIVGSNYEASIKIGRDPTTCVDGFKFDFGWSGNNTCRDLSFELAGNIHPISGNATIKASTYYVLFDVLVPDCQADLCGHEPVDCYKPPLEEVIDPIGEIDDLRTCLPEEIKNLTMYKEGLNYTIELMSWYPAYDSGEDQTTFRYKVCTAKKELNCAIRRFMRDRLPTVEHFNPTAAISNIVIQVIGTCTVKRYKMYDSNGVNYGQDFPGQLDEYGNPQGFDIVTDPNSCVGGFKFDIGWDQVTGAATCQGDDNQWCREIELVIAGSVPTTNGIASIKASKGFTIHDIKTPDCKTLCAE